jgi:rhamnosyl/mannosyltransferase
MRVVHVCPTYFDPRSVIAGGERYSYGLAKAMSRVTPTTLVSFGDEAFETRDGDLLFRCYERWAYVKGQRNNPFTPAFVRDVLAADVVHCHQFLTVPSDVAILAALLARKKSFVTDLSGNSSFSLSYHFPLWRAVSAFLLISNFNRSVFEYVSIPKVVIYGGVETDHFKPSQAPRTKRILAVGRLVSHKGFHTLIEALDPDMELDVVGRPHDPAYVDALRRAAAGKRVHFHLAMDDKDLLPAYQTAAVVAIPTEVDGGYTTALEAMACKTPVVGTRVGSLPEVIDDGKTGFIVPSGDVAALKARLRRILDDEALARSMGEAGLQRVETAFTWARVVERCMQAYAA